MNNGTPSVEMTQNCDFRRDPHHRHGMHRAIVGSVVIALGAILLVRELGLLPKYFALWELWPLLVIGAGLGQISRSCSLLRTLFGLAIAAIGIAFLLDNIGVLAIGAIHYWPVLIILMGAAIVFGSKNRGHTHFSTERSSEDFIRRAVTFGGLRLKVGSQQFKGGELSAVMGGMEIDMRGAAIVEDEAVLTVSTSMGGIELRIPESWQLVHEITSTLGAVEDKTTSAIDPEQQRPRLVLKGSVFMGAVEIKN